MTQCKTVLNRNFQERSSLLNVPPLVKTKPRLRVVLMGGIIFSVVTGCSYAGGAAQKETVENSPTVSRDSTYKAVVREGAGEISFPTDQYESSAQGYLLETSAMYLDLALCLHEKGMPSYWAQRENIGPEENRRYGRWIMSNAESHAYVLVPDKELERAFQWEALFNAEHEDVLSSEQYEKAESECLDTPSPDLMDALGGPPLPDEISKIGNQTYDLMLASDDAAAVFADWEVCLNEAGLERVGDDDPYGIVGVDYSVASEQSIKVAVTDVACKQETDFVQRLADIEASFQGPVVKKYEAELAELHAFDEKVTENRKAFLNANAAKGEALWKP